MTFSTLHMLLSTDVPSEVIKSQSDNTIKHRNRSSILNVSELLNRNDVWNLNVIIIVWKLYKINILLGDH